MQVYMNILKKSVNRLQLFFYALLKFDRARFYFCRLRWILFKKHVQIYQDQHDDTGEKTVTHNLDAFSDNAVFGMSKRMGLLIYPVLAFYRNNPNVKILIVGCRTEDDIFWLKAYGIKQVYGFDLISYSKHVMLGDFHQSGLDSDSYDVVILGWMISYTKNPQLVIKESKRILKNGGLLGIGLDHCHREVRQQSNSPAANELNNAEDLVGLVNGKVIFFHEFDYSGGDNCAAVFRIAKADQP